MKHYSNKEIRELISCPQFGDIKYGKWGSQKLEIRETLLHLITLNDEMDKMLKDRLLRINKAIEYIDMIQERRKGLSVEEYHNKWCKLFDYYESQCIMLDLLDILKGSDKE